MNTKRKTLKMPVRYLMNAVLVALLFVGLSFLTQNVLSTYQNKVLLTVGINIILAVSNRLSFVLIFNLLIVVSFFYIPRVLITTCRKGFLDLFL